MSIVEKSGSAPSFTRPQHAFRAHAGPRRQALARRDVRLHRAPARARLRGCSWRSSCPTTTASAATPRSTRWWGSAAGVHLRHAARLRRDHIAAVDNTTRKLLTDRAEQGHGTGPVGRFLVLLGHSTIVFVLAFLLSVGVKALAGQVEDDASELHSVTGVIGASVSGVFLWVLGCSTSWPSWASSGSSGGCVTATSTREARGAPQQPGPDEPLPRRPDPCRAQALAHYPIGVLFGLGFDTATEVPCSSWPEVPPRLQPALLRHPRAAGPLRRGWLLWTPRRVLMNGAYGWAFLKPVRKVFYNMTITAISVAVALLIGTIELAVGVLADQAHIVTGPRPPSPRFPSTTRLQHRRPVRLAWVLAVAVWHFGHIEERWSAHLEPSPRRDHDRPLRRRHRHRLRRMLHEPPARNRCPPRRPAGAGPPRDPPPSPRPRSSSSWAPTARTSPPSTSTASCTRSPNRPCAHLPHL